ncbi:LytTR family DNA-binding domain-containing protein [Emticicia sp. BO119]|uniref:LytR/AlgR family response regulator transcription factor n=1 Tax=Emticicia sp. BO119 TaxID=2757768 RepID=UPI0015F0C4A3|nr:LytTR family DNA-binding domain-containing protein [Emticicia sp. BO119]MBA4850398.1 LytTR family transcriptional regulator [Emticicia sp. BO119]
METNLISIGGRQKVNSAEVLFLLADANYTLIMFEDGKKVFVATTLGELERRFIVTNFFYRTHRSFLVNLQHIETIEKNKVVLKNKTSVLVSRRKREVLQEKFFRIA